MAATEGGADPFEEQSPVILGSLFFSGAVWVTLSMVLGESWPDLRSAWLVWGAVGAAYLTGGLLILGGWQGRRLPLWAAEVLTAVGSLAATSVVLGGGDFAAGVYGGFYGYVAAYSFLYFPRWHAAGQTAFFAGLYAISLVSLDVPAPWSHWVTVIGIAIGGAGLVGIMGARTREAAQIEAEAANKMQELESVRRSFIRAISHEVRTPLTLVVGVAQTLEDAGERLSPEQRADLVSRLVTNAHKLQLLLTDLMDIDRLERDDVEARREPVHLPTLVHDATAQVSMRDHEISYDVEDERVWVEASKVERILVNLTANAVRHTPPGTSVLVAAHLSDSDLVLEVSDDGPGIPSRLLGRVFDPFVQGPDAAGEASPGIGIGLSMVARFANMHDGEVTAENNETGGATFRVRLADAREPTPT